MYTSTVGPRSPGLGRWHLCLSGEVSAHLFLRFCATIVRSLQTAKNDFRIDQLWFFAAHTEKSSPNEASPTADLVIGCHWHRYSRNMQKPKHVGVLCGCTLLVYSMHTHSFHTLPSVCLSASCLLRQRVCIFLTRNT